MADDVRELFSAHYLPLVRLAIRLVGDQETAEVANGRDSNDRAAGTASPFVGYRWAAVQVQDSYGTATVPASMRAWIGFTRDGYVLGNDTINPLQGEYQLGSSGYQLHAVHVGLVRWDGAPTAVGTRVILAVDEMFIARADPTTGTAPPVIVTAQVSGDRLTLSRNGVVLTLQRSGKQPDFGDPRTEPGQSLRWSVDWPGPRS